MDDAGGGRRGLRPLPTPAIADAVERTWGFAIDQAVSLGVGSTGLNLVVRTASEPVVVRVHRHHVTAARVEALQMARQVVGEAGVPTASVVRGRAGERQVSVGGTVVEVEQFIETGAKMDSFDRTKHAISTLARLHDALDGATLPDAANDLRFANYLPAAELVARTFVGSNRARLVDPSLRPLADRAERLAGQLQAAADGLAPLEEQWSHGDFWDTNVLFHHDQVALVCDFGFMNRRPRIDDLALTLYFTLWNFDVSGRADPRGALAALVNEYNHATHLPLSVAERAMLPLAVARQPLWSIGVWAAQLDDPSEVRAHLTGHERALRLGEDVLAELDHWRRALADQAR